MLLIVCVREEIRAARHNYQNTFLHIFSSFYLVAQLDNLKVLISVLLWFHDEYALVNTAAASRKENLLDNKAF